MKSVSAFSNRAMATRLTTLAAWMLACCFPIIALAQDGQARFQAADRSLNATYGKVMRDLPLNAKNKLRDAQRLWIGFRDANAVLASAIREADTEVGAVQLAVDTEQRAAVLETYFARKERDKDWVELFVTYPPLDETYRDALLRLSEPDAANLRRAQEAWIATRDADLRALASIDSTRAENKGATFTRTCMEQRVAFLRELRSVKAGIGPSVSSGVEATTESKISEKPSDRMAQGTGERESGLPASSASPTEPSSAPVLRIEAGMHTAALPHVSADTAGRLVLTVSDDKTARLWELPSGKLLRVLRPPLSVGHEGKLYSGALSADGAIAAVAGWTKAGTDDYNVYLFDTATGQLVRRLSGLPDVIRDLAFSSRGHFLAAVGGGWGVSLQ